MRDLDHPLRNAVGDRTRPVSDDMRQIRNRSLCLLYTSDAADERSSVDLGGRRIIKKKKQSQRLQRLIYTSHNK